MSVSTSMEHLYEEEFQDKKELVASFRDSQYKPGCRITHQAVCFHSVGAYCVLLTSLCHVDNM